MGVVDPSGCDELGADGVIQRADLIVGVRDHDRSVAFLAGAGGETGKRADPVGVGGVDVDLVAGEQYVEYCAGVVAGAHGKAQLGVVLVRHRGERAVPGDDGADEAMHRVEFPAGVRGHLSGGQVEHSPAADGGQLVPVTDQRDPSVVFVGDGQ